MKNLTKEQALKRFYELEKEKEELVEIICGSENEKKAPAIEWVKCHHGVEKRDLMGCSECRKEKDNLLKSFTSAPAYKNPVTKIAIIRGCHSGSSGCFCTGACQEIIGYREPDYPGEGQINVNAVNTGCIPRYQ